MAKTIAILVAVAAIAGVALLSASATRKKSVKRIATPADSRKSTATRVLQSPFSLNAIPSLAGKIAIVTGANTGIGYHVAKHLALNGAKVYLACRNEVRAKAAINKLNKEAEAKGRKLDLEFVQLDLGDFKQTKAAALDLSKKLDRLDILIDNAGIMDVVSTVPFKLNKDGFEQMFATNHLGHFIFTKYLLPVILKTPGTPRIVVLSSSATWMAPTTGIEYDSLKQHKEGMTQMNYYGQSKLANSLFATELNKRYGKQIVATAVHPGVVDTELIRPDPFTAIWFVSLFINPGHLILKMITAEQGSFSTLFAATWPESDSLRGKFIVPFGVVSDDHHPLALNSEHAKKLWDYSEDAISKF